MRLVMSFSCRYTFYGIQFVFFSPSSSKKMIYWAIVYTGSNVYSIWFTCTLSQGNAWTHSSVVPSLENVAFIHLSFCRYGRKVVTILLSGFAISPKQVRMRLGAREKYRIAAVKT